MTTPHGVDLTNRRHPTRPSETSRGRGRRVASAAARASRVLGAGLLLATGATHLDLYLTGYRTIPTIGALFLAQVAASFVLALWVLATRGRLAPAAGAAFALGTLGGYVVSLRTPLFGFREVFTDPGVAAGTIEVVALAALAGLALGRVSASGSGPLAAPLDRAAASRAPRWVAATLWLVAAAALVASLVSARGQPSGAGAGTATLKVASIAGAAVLTNAAGHTLYWFGPDSPTRSACDASCTPYWTPVFGTPAAGVGVHGLLGTIRRSDASTQVTYDGHPLYTYVGDSGPGQAHGNNITLNGGLWHEMLLSGGR